MKSLLFLVAPAALLIPAAMVAAPGADDSFMIKGATVHTMAGAAIENGSVIVRNGKIIGVGKNLAVPKDLKVIDGKGMQVYPGMIDAATEVGLVEINSIRESLDTTEIGKYNPQLVALTAVNPSRENIPVTRYSGITTVATMPEGQVIGGQVSLMHLDGWTTDEMGVKPRAGLHMRFPAIAAGGGRGGFVASDETGGGPAGRASFTEAKRNYDKEIADLNEFFESAHRYKQSKDAKVAGFKPDLKLEAMIPVIEGKEPIMVSASREREIRDAIAFADKQKVKIILCEAQESNKVTKEIKEHNIPVILGPVLTLPSSEDAAYDQSFTVAAELQKAGIVFSLGSLRGKSNIDSRNLPFQAAQAVAFGLPKEDAMKAVTKNAADIWGVGDQIGTLEEGKWADLLVSDGDPLEAQSNIKLLFIKGKPVDLGNKQHDLYEKYLNRPAGN
jgi:imidazolonepropionase-like amidohydrolase